eukprot:2694704-Rhodomonas_salina.3
MQSASEEERRRRTGDAGVKTRFLQVRQMMPGRRAGFAFRREGFAVVFLEEGKVVRQRHFFEVGPALSCYALATQDPVLASGCMPLPCRASHPLGRVPL